MTIHYHGTPITPRAVLDTLAGRHFCVSFAHPNDVARVHEIGQSIMLDNGAYSMWTRGSYCDWPSYYRWTETWLAYQTTWAVIPDVVDGDERINDRLVAEWPHGPRGAPVWHLHESIARLKRLAEEWPRVCLGSSREFSRVGSPTWHARMTAAMNALCTNGLSPTWLHMLRGTSLSGAIYPFASVDSTDIALSHHRHNNNARAMADRWDALQCPGRWERRPVQASLDYVPPVTA